jgi:Zn-dependent peptidase ImmA (M78 family)
VSYRDDILSAVYEASRLHMEFESEAKARDREGRVDVFGMFVAKDIPVLFRPLRTLLGAYINEPDKGVIITSQRPLRVQRFTAAHELGHAMLGHQASLDEERILTRALFQTARGYDRREIQANAFASQLLTPSWLIVQHLNRQGWTRESLSVTFPPEVGPVHC